MDYQRVNGLLILIAGLSVQMITYGKKGKRPKLKLQCLKDLVEEDEPRKTKEKHRNFLHKFVFVFVFEIGMGCVCVPM